MPFLDSVMDGTVAFVSRLVLTLVEFIASLVIHRLHRDDFITSRVRLVLNVIVVSCMVGKMRVALVAISPLKENVADTDGVVTDDAVAGSEVAALKEAKVECGIANSEGEQV